jgi:tetratricopeptide (TPR) repeat protein
MRRLQFARLLSAAFLPVICALLASCSTARAPRSQSNPDAVKETSFWQPQLLYILPSPHSRLYVEVDAVEGCQPSDATLNKLRDFLSTYCNKPDGIDIVRGDVIPAATARGISLRALARKFINGPPDDETASPPAYLYVLYCDPALCDKPVLADADRPTVNTASHHEPAVRRPHVDFLPYPPVMYINPRYGPKNIQNDLLIHEAGHELGLAGRATNAFAYHCLDKKCLMNWTLRYHIGRSLLGMDPVNQHQLCPLCIAQLTESAKQSSPKNLRFVGPVLVRSENDYFVLSLPDRMKVIVGNLTEKDCGDFAAGVRAERILSNGDETRVEWQIKDEVLDKFAKVSDSFDQAKVDPLEPVRATAPKIFAQYCFSRGQFAKAIRICREAINSNPKDDSGYNLLAWIEATCPDSSVRDGKEAVSFATKACELTDWKESSLVDTLAAAYAESGDFQRAIQFQGQALRVGNAPESEQKAMRERLALYKQSQPYREKQ